MLSLPNLTEKGTKLMTSREPQTNDLLLGHRRMITKLSGPVRPLFCLPLQPVDLEIHCISNRVASRFLVVS